MPAPTLDTVTDNPDAALLAWEAELEALMVEWADLDDAWPKGKTAMERYEIGCRHRDCLARIREIQQAIVDTEARTVAGAAVQLRRLEVLLDREDRATAIRLLASALGALESHSAAA